MERKHVERLIEFLLIGVGMGLVEDLIAVWFSTGTTITLDIVFVVLMVAIPFAMVSELVVDHEDFHFLKAKKKSKR